MSGDVDESCVARTNDVFRPGDEFLVGLGLPSFLQDADGVLTVRPHDHRPRARRDPLECAQDRRQLRDVVRRFAEVFDELVRFAVGRDSDDPGPRRPGVSRTRAVGIRNPRTRFRGADVRRSRPLRRRRGRGRHGARLVGKERRPCDDLEIARARAVRSTVVRLVSNLDSSVFDRERPIGSSPSEHALALQHRLDPRHRGGLYHAGDFVGRPLRAWPVRRLVHSSTRAAER
jgi:hypothetical protein